MIVRKQRNALRLLWDCLRFRSGLPLESGAACQVVPSDVKFTSNPVPERPASGPNQSRSSAGKWFFAVVLTPAAA